MDVLASDFDVRQVDGTDRAALLAALADADAVIVRSATQIDAQAIGAAPRLQVVARAGVGLDNVDVPAATARGVLVVNAPTSNIVSAAEQAIALLLAVARHTSVAHASLRRGEWQRSRFTGVEIQGKTVGVVGLGRIGVLFAQRMAAFGTRLIAYDPYVQPARAAQLGVRLVGLDELLRDSDFISIHLPKTPETLGLIGEKELRLVKPTVRIVNAARGGLIDEQALAEKLGKVFTAVAGGIAANVDVEVRGSAVAHDVSVLKLAVTKGLFNAVVEEQVTYVNAPHLAAARGVEVRLATVAESVEQPTVVSVRGALPSGRTLSASGILTPGGERLTELDGYLLELAADGVLLFFRYLDRPGVVGTVGTILGTLDVNIAAMQVARRAAGGEALMTLTVDSPVHADLLAKAAAAIGATAAATVDLTED
ncbi:MAG: hypothetical protein AUG44_13090 [Actinobacteria bacterium 13_1_20CM_3_71_11]|nr:MAG: hypothetical protein AUG44_13090 [Actinobacteria bacterium 13_1_20CM_3_71_11]